MNTLSGDFRFRSLVLKSKGPVDGDGDGFVYDGKPNMRPATPAEMEAGRLLREAKNGSFKPQEATSARKQRVSLYDNAVRAAKTPQDIEAIADTLGNDKKLGGEDRVRITEALQAKAEKVGGKGPKKPDSARGGTVVPPDKPTKRPKKPQSAPETPEQDVPGDQGTPGPEKPVADGWDDEEIEALQRAVQDPKKRKQLLDAIEQTSDLDDAEKARVLDAIRRFGEREDAEAKPAPKKGKKTPEQQVQEAKERGATKPGPANVQEPANKPDPESLPDRDRDGSDANTEPYDPDQTEFDHLSEYVDNALGAAKRPYDLEQLAMDVNEQDWITAKEKKELLQRIDSKMDELIQADKDNPLLVDDGGPGMKLSGDDRPEIVKAQQDHFAKGGSIGDAPAAGLWNHVRSDPDRFEVKENGTAGKSVNFWVTDKKTGEKWMFKEGMYDGEHFDGGEHDPIRAPDTQDVFSENLAASIMVEAGFDMPDTKFASSPDGRILMMAQRHYGEQFGVDILDPETEAHKQFINRGPKVDGVPEAKMRQDAMDSLAKGEDPGAVARMMVVDYLMNNSIDRHKFNAMLTRGKDGELRMAIIDHGLGFEGGTAADANRPGKGGLGPDQITGEQFMDAYSTLMWNPSQVAGGVAGGDKATLKSQLQAALDGMMKVDADKVRARLEQQGQMSERQMDLMDDWLGEFEWRRQWLADNMDAMVDKIAERGGWA